MAYYSGAAAAAAARRRRMLEEEERMTPYSDDELQNDWEFKIVRANYGAFRGPERLNRLIEQEKQAGWVLLEKLDDSRVRFKRLRSAQANDSQLIASGIDPYRTQYGMDQRNIFSIVAITIGCLILGSLVAVIAFTVFYLPYSHSIR